MWSSPAEFANNVHNSSRNTWIFIRVHQALLYLWPGSPQGLGVDEREAVQSDKGLLSNVRMAVAHSRQ